MAGHNKWSKVKHIKAVQDKKKAALYSKLVKEIMVAARAGSDMQANARLRKAVEDAKAQSVPKDNIERAIKRGSGEDEKTSLEEVTYEGIGPSGVSILVDCVTDNRLRTQPEIRKIFQKHGGQIAELGAVSWAFDPKGLILIESKKASEEQLIEICVPAGAQDIINTAQGFEIYTEVESFHNVLAKLQEHHIPYVYAELTKISQTEIQVSSEDIEKIQALLDALEEHDDVHKVHSNLSQGED